MKLGRWRRSRAAEVDPDSAIPDWVLAVYELAGPVPHPFFLATRPLSFEVEVDRCSECGGEFAQGETVWIGFDPVENRPYVQHPTGA